MGGMDIEAVSRENPEEIIRMEIDPFTGLKGYQLKYLAKRLRVEDEKDLCSMVQKVQHAFFQAGALLVEINPLGLVDGKLVAMDSKFVIDGNARHMRAKMEELESGRQNLHAYKAPEKEATTITLSLIHISAESISVLESCFLGRSGRSSRRTDGRGSGLSEVLERGVGVRHYFGRHMCGNSC